MLPVSISDSGSRSLHQRSPTDIVKSRTSTSLLYVPEVVGKGKEE